MDPREPGRDAGARPDGRDEQVQVLGEDFILPLIRGEMGPALRGRAPILAAHILEDEEVARALRFL